MQLAQGDLSSRGSAGGIELPNGGATSPLHQVKPDENKITYNEGIIPTPGIYAKYLHD